VQRTAWLLAFGLMTLACAGVWSFSVINDRRSVLAVSEQKLAATATLLEQHADRALETGDRIIRAAVLAVGEPPARWQEAQEAALHQTLRALIAGSRQVASLWVVDATGRVVAETWQYPPNRGPILHRAYFQAHQRGEQGLHVGEMAMGPSARQLRFTLSRPLLAADGSFAGVVAAGVLSGGFGEVYAGAGLGPGARFALFRDDGAPLALWPLDEGAGAEAWTASLAEARADGPERLAAERRLARFPVRLVVGQPRAAALDEWRRRTLITGGMMAGVLAALGALTALGLRGARQQRALLRALGEERAVLERRVAARTADLVQGEARLRDTLESMTDAFVALDHDFRVTDLNRRALKLDGRPAEALLGHSHWDLWPAANGTPVETAYRHAMQSRVPVQLEHRYQSETHDIWLDIRAFPTSTGLALFYSDITSRKAAEAALRESELERRLATEGAQVGIWEIDLASGRGRWSKEAMVLFGVERDVFTEQDWTDAILPADRAAAGEAWRRTVEDGAPYEVEFRAAAAAGDGTERWLLSRGHVERDAEGRPLRGAGVMLDVTARVRAEAQTRQTLAELRSVYDTAPVGLCVIDLAGRFVRINERLAAINGLPAEAHIGRTVRELLPGIADAAEALQRTVIETGEPVLNVEIVGETPAKPGVTRVWEEHWYPLRDRDGRLVGINVVAEEVTARKEAEQRQLLLAREVDHRAKNALTMVQSVLRLTRDEDPRKFAQAVEGRVAALARVQGLLADVHWSGVDLRTLLGGELAAFLPQQPGSEEDPGIHLDGAPVVLTALAAQPISMITHELATNATKYGALSVARGQVALTWSIDRDHRMLRLRWTERDGPRIEGAPTRRGFGTRVVDSLVERQLGGVVTRAWKPEGLVCDIALPLGRAVVEDAREVEAAPVLAASG
jgi:PAS domain S-box-containing protein